MSGSKNDFIISKIDGLFEKLIEEACPDTTPDQVQDQNGSKIDFLDRLKLASEAGKWLLIRNRVNPEEDTDAFTAERDKLVGRSRGGGSSR